MSTKIFEIPPDTSVFEKLGATGEPAYKAVAELIDNCIDAASPSNPVIVELNFDVYRGRIKSITIEDNATGMTQIGLVDALKIGKSEKTNQKKIGRFGMGMKTALASLGRAWTITTCTREDKLASQISEDLDRFVSSGKWQVEVNTVPKTYSHGTTIEIRRCDHITASHFEQSLNNNLGELFKHFLESELLQLYVNGEPVAVPEVNLIEGTKIEIDTVIADRRVQGWIGLRKQGGNNYGFSLIRYNRVVMRNEKIGFNVHQQYNRIVGELHLDDFEVNHHKTAFVQTTEAWEEFKSFISEAVRPVVQKAHELASRDRRSIHREVQRLVEMSFDRLFDSILQDTELKVLATTGKKHNTNLLPNSNKNKDFNTTNNFSDKPRRVSPLENLRRRVEWVNDGEDAPKSRWLYENGELSVFINLDHPAHPKAEGQHHWAIEQSIESIAAFVATERSKMDLLEEPSLSFYETVLDKVYRHAVFSEILI
jgi:hypothetical protein